jgi:serine/threonine-protein kinase
VERFRREAGLAERLRHPNVVRILDHGVENGLHYLVMEYVEGLTLDRLIERKGSLTVNETVSYTEQACAGLQAAFQAGVVHRDIKPANLMITPDGTVKIMDFGIARMEAMVGLTQSGMFMGTPRYISPEMARGAGADIRSDLYSLGLLAYEMLAGSPPFDAENPWAVLRQQIESEPEPIHQKRADVPPWLEAIIVRAVAKDPAARFQTPAEMLAALKQRTARPEQVQPVAPAPPPAAVTMVAEVPRQSRLSRGLVLGLLAAGILVVVVVAVVFAWTSGGTPTPTVTNSGAEAQVSDATTVPGATATALVVVVTNTASPTLEVTDTPVPSDTPTEPPTVEPTDTEIPTPEPTETPVPEPTETLTPAPTEPPPATNTPSPEPTAGPTHTPQPSPTPTTPPTAPPPPVTGRIAFSAGGQLHIVEAATGDDTIAPIANMRQPDLRADGQLVIAKGFQGDKTSVWTINANTGAFVREQSPFTDDYHPFWSPDGSMFVYDSLHQGKGEYNIYKNVLDSNVDEFLYTGSMAIIGRYPVWMHDDWVAFTGCDYWVAGGGSKCGIYRMPSWSGPPAMVHPGDLTMRATDNHGGLLLYMSQETGDWEVYVIPSQGGQGRSLSEGAGYQDGLGTFSPDGKMVAFVSNRGGSWAVWALGADGSGLTKLFDLPQPLSGDWTDEHISWGP